MTGEVIKEFLVGLGFNVDEHSLASFKESLSSASIGAAALGAAVTAAAGSVFATVQHVAKTYFELDKLASQFRTTASAVDEFIDVGQVLGLSEEQTVGSLKSLDRAIGDTALGIGRAKIVFQQIGQSVLDAGGKMRPTTVVMDELAEKFSKMERGKALAVMERLGLDPALLKMFNADLITLRKEINDIEEAAGFNMADAIDQSKQFTKSWRAFTQEIEKVKLVFSKMVDVVSVRLMPRFRASLDSFTGQIAALRLIVMRNMESIQGAIDGAINVMLRLVSFVSISATRLIQLISNIVGGIVTLFGKLTPFQQSITLGVLALVAAWKFLNLSFLATPLGMILTLIAGIALLVDDFLVWKEGGDSLINWGGAFGKILFVVTGMVAALTAAFVISQAAMMAYAGALAIAQSVMGAVRTAAALFNVVLAMNPVTLWAAAIVAAVALVAGIAYLIYDNWQPILDWFAGAWSSLTDGLQALMALLTGGFLTAWQAVSGVISAVGATIAAVISGMVSPWDPIMDGIHRLIALLTGGFIAAWHTVGSVIGTVGETIASMTGGILQAWEKVSGVIGSVGSTLSSLTGGLVGGSAMLTPSPAMAGGGGSNQQVSQQTDIIVQASNNPEATAKAVAREQQRVNADLARNLKGAVR